MANSESSSGEGGVVGPTREGWSGVLPGNFWNIHSKRKILTCFKRSKFYIRTGSFKLDQGFLQKNLSW